MAVSACRSSPPSEEDATPIEEPDTAQAATPAMPGAPGRSGQAATRPQSEASLPAEGAAPVESLPGLAPAAAEVRAAFEASRDALRRLDADAYLAGYASGPGLVVLDPAGELVGREAFERFVRDWFAAAHRRSPTYPVITSGERVYPLDERTAVVVVHWSAPGGEEPHRSLLVYRKEGGVWRITAEQSAPLPASGGQEAEPTR